jgi:hypothetical protein
MASTEYWVVPKQEGGWRLGEKSVFFKAAWFEIKVKRKGSIFRDATETFLYSVAKGE